MDTRKQRICILGNSVGFKMRPPRQSAEEKTYGEILSDNGYCVRNISKAGVMLNEAFASLDDELITWFPDTVIIQFGVVEMCQRQTSRRLNNRLIKNYYLNMVHGRAYVFDSLFTKVLETLGRIVNGGGRRFVGLVGLRWQWLSLDRFLSVLEAVLEHVNKETGAMTLMVGINPVSPRITRILPDSGEIIEAANAAMKNLAARFPGRVRFLDMKELIGGNMVETTVPDGIHLSAQGHRLLAERILDELGTRSLRP